MQKPTNEQFIAAAKGIYGTDDLEIDDGAAVSHAAQDGGAWVAAWVWVSEADAMPDDPQTP